MRRLLAALVVALVPTVVGLAPAAAPAAPDPGRRLAAALLTAATQHDARGIWRVLSTPSRRRLGPTFAAFERTNAAAIQRALVPFESPSVKLFVDQTVSSRFGLVAMRNGTRALAFPLRREQAGWRIETPGPINLRILGPTPGSRGPVTQVAFEASGPAGIGDAIIFVDGRLYPPKLASAGRKATVFVTLPKQLRRGVHIAVAYAEQGAAVSALAWSFAAA